MMRKADEALAQWGMPLALLLTLVSGITALDNPVFGDAQAYMIPNAQQMAATSFYPFIENEVHPPLYFLIQAVAFRLMGERVEVAHALILFFALATVVAVYALGRSLGGQLVGSAAAILVALWPPFLIQARFIRLSVPLAAFCTLSLLSLRRGWAALYVLFGTCAALTKAPGILIPGAAAILGSLGLVRLRTARWILWLPVVLYGAWLVACKLHYGWFLYPENVADFRFSVVGIIDGWSFWTKRLLIDQHAWVVAATALLLLARQSYGYLVPPLALGALGIVVPGLSLLSTLSLGLFAVFFWFAWRESGFWRLMATTPLLFTLLFAPYHYHFPRYLVPAWPAMAVILMSLFARQKHAVLVIPVFACLFAWSATRTAWDGWHHHECNLQASEFIGGRKAAAAYLEANAGDKLIIARKPAEDLTNPAFGYVTKPLRVLEEDRLRRLRCGGVRRAHYYYQLPTMSGRSEQWMSTLLRSCRTRVEPVFGFSYTFRSKPNEKIVIYRLQHRRPQPGTRSAVEQSTVE